MSANTDSLRTPADIANLPKSGSLLLLSDQQKDNVKISDVNISASSFVRIGMKGAEIKDSSFTQSNFEDSYFRKAAFNNVHFTGSSFRFCNFDKASFQACDFRYCSFYHCKLPKDEIIACLPSESNLRRDLARNLRANYEMIGDKKSADTFLDIENQANEAELSAIFWSKTQYYKGRYNNLDQVKSGLKFMVSWFSGLIWGYGHSVGRLFLSYFIITCILSFITYMGETNFRVLSDGVQHPLNFWQSIYAGFSQTVGLSGLPFKHVTLLGKIIMLIESFLGTLFLALFAAIFYRRIAR